MVIGALLSVAISSYAILGGVAAFAFVLGLRG